MAQATYWFGKGRLHNIDWANDDIKLMLLTAGYTPSQTEHEYVDDVGESEVSGAGYTAGGVELAGKSKTYDAVNNVIRYKASDVLMSDASFTARWGVLYKDTGNPGTSPLIAYIDFGSSITADDVPFFVRWHLDGVLVEMLSSPEEG